jgi:opacity protein-like surface antigen
MRISTTCRRAAAALACWLWLPVTAAAQDDRGAVVSGSVSAAVIESHTDVGFSGSFGYRFSRVFGIEIEATAVPSLNGPVPNYPVILSNATFWSSVGGSASPQIFPGPTLSDAGGRLVIFTNNARVEIPTLSDRVLPYFVAGGGIASTRRTAQFFYPAPIIAGPSVPALPVAPRPISQPLVSASTDLALTIGGGVGIRVAKRMSIDVDLRLFRLLGADDVNVGRFGVGARYRF